MQSKQSIRKLLEIEHSSKKALELGAFEDQAMEAMIDDDFISLEESNLAKSTLNTSDLGEPSLGDEK